LTVPVAVPPAVAVRVVFSGGAPLAGFALSAAVSVGGEPTVMLVRCSAGGALPRSMMTFALYVPGVAYALLTAWVAASTLLNFAPNVAFVGSPHTAITVLTLVLASVQFHQKV
jgi:hypothetical protein